MTPHPSDENLRVLGRRETVALDKYFVGLHRGEGYAGALRFDAPIWWVVKQVPSSDPWSGVVHFDGKTELGVVDVVFAGTPVEAVDYLASSGLHTSAAIMGARLRSARRHDTVVVGELGVALSAFAQAVAGGGGIAVVLANGRAVAGDWGIAVAGYDGVAISGARGQSYAGQLGMAMTGKAGMAVAGDGGRAIGSYVVVGDDATAEILFPQHGSVVSAGKRGHIVYRGISFDEAAGDFEANVAYTLSDGQLVRAPHEDACLADALVAAECRLRPGITAEYFWDNRPLATEEVKSEGLYWTESFCSEGERPRLPPALEAHARRTYEAVDAVERRHSFAVVQGGMEPTEDPA